MQYIIRDLLKLKECDHFTKDLTDEALDKPLVGAIFWVDLNRKDMRGSEQSGIRPCIILNNYIEFDEIQVFSLVPLSTQLKALHLPTHILIEPTPRNGLKSRSIALSEQFRATDSSCLKEPIGIIDYDNYIKIITSIAKNLGLCYQLDKNQGCANDYFNLIEKLFVGIND